MLLAALLVAFLPAIQNSDAPTSDDFDPLAQRRVDGALAPPGCWYTRGGTASHSGVARTAPVHGTPTETWRYSSDGQIVGEPLVWKSQIVLEVLRKDARRQLEIVDLSDGHRVATSPPYETATPLSPSIWGWRIVARTGSERLEGLRVNGKTLTNIWKLEGIGPLSAPVLFGGDVYLHANGKLARIPFGRKKPVWSVGGQYRGEVAILGDSVFGFQQGDRPTANLVDRATGAPKGVSFAGFEDANPRSSAGPNVQPLADGRVVIQRPGFLMLNSGGVGDTAVCSAKGEPLPMWFAHIAPAVFESSLLGFTADDQDRVALIMLRGQSPSAPSESAPRTGQDTAKGKARNDVRAVVLANGEFHAEFVRSPVPPSLAGNVAYVGASAFDLQSMRILYSLPIEARFRAVPVAEGVLLVDGTSSLVLMSSAARVQAAGTLLVDFSKPESDGRVHVRAGTAVWRDGSMQSGPMKLSKEKGVTFSSAERPGPKEGAFDDMALVLDAKRNVLYAAPGDMAVDAMRLVIEDEMAKRWTDLAAEAGPARDPALLDRILGKARQLGSTDARLDRAQELQERLEREAQPIDKAKQKLIEDKERLMLHMPALLMAERAKGLSADAPPVLRATLASAAIEDDKECEDARTSLQALLPKGLEDVPAEAALDVIEAGQATPMHAVDDADKEDADARVLARARKKWRPDLRGMRSANLLIIAPASRVGIAARCLDTGELVCRALQQVFPPREDATDPLLLYLYESREEYMRALESNGKAVGIAKMSAGVYDMRANITRIFLPDNQEALRSLLSVYAHELTHHWLSARWGAVEDDDRRESHVDNQSFWIVEGLATMIEEFSFDPRAGTWSTTSAGSERLDILANRPAPLKVLDWGKFFAITQRDLNTVDSKTALGRVRKRNHLGFVDVLTRPYFFYCQAAATCHFLYNAEGGAYRAKLLAFAANWYTNKTSELDIVKSFGIAPEELGHKIEEWATITSADPH